MKKTLKKHERQNIKRRYGCDWQNNIQSVTEQQGECAVCGDTPKTKLRADPWKNRTNMTGFLHMVCRHCYHVIQRCAQPGSPEHARMRGYFGLRARGGWASLASFA